MWHTRCRWRYVFYVNFPASYSFLRVIKQSHAEWNRIDETMLDYKRFGWMSTIGKLI